MFTGLMKLLMNSCLILVRMLIVGVAVFGIVSYNIDSHLKSEYGMTTIYIIVGMLSFFPLFIPLFIEFYSYQKKKGKKIKNLEKDSYLKESTKNNPLDK